MTTSPAAVGCSGPEAATSRILALDRDDGTLSERYALEVPAPLFAAIGPSGERCYTTHDHAGGQLRAWAIGEDGFRELDRVATGGSAPAYVSLSADGGAALVANYGGGSIAAVPIGSDGGFEDSAQVIEHEGSGADPERQTAPHPHAIVPTPAGEALVVPDLGTDEVWRHGFDSERGRIAATDAARLSIHDGAGPRHVAFQPEGGVAYLANELDSTLSVLGVAPETGSLGVEQTIGTLPEAVEDDVAAENYPADVHVHPSGEWLYCSNRGHDSIAVVDIAVAHPAEVELRETVPCGGEWPREIAIGPAGEFLFVANRHSDRVLTFAIDQRDGSLTRSGEAELVIEDPVCLAFCAAEN